MAQKGISSCPPESVCPSVFWEHNSTMFPGDLAVKYRLVGRRLLPRNMSRSDVSCSPSCAPFVLYLLPPPWLEVPGQPWEPGLKMKKLVAPCVLNQELRSYHGTTTWKRNTVYIRPLISGVHCDQTTLIPTVEPPASCILPSIYHQRPIGAGMDFASTICWINGRLQKALTTFLLAG